MIVRDCQYIGEGDMEGDMTVARGQCASACDMDANMRVRDDRSADLFHAGDDMETNMIRGGRHHCGVCDMGRRLLCDVCKCVRVCKCVKKPRTRIGESQLTGNHTEQFSIGQALVAPHAKPAQKSRT